MNSEKAFKVLDYFHKGMNLANYSKIFEWIEEFCFGVLIKNPLQQQSRSTCENAFSGVTMTDFHYGRYLVIRHFEHACVSSVCSDQANPQSQREVQGVVLHHRWRNILAAPVVRIGFKSVPNPTHDLREPRDATFQLV